MFPNATDETLIRKLHAHFGKTKKHPKYEEPRFSDKSLNFSIVHYADVVTYDATSWLEKNKDPLQPDLETTLRESKNPFVRRLFTETYDELPTSLTEFQKKGAKGASFVTVAAQYKAQLASLMATLQSTNPHFVRCILPNHLQKPGFLEDRVVLDQLRCNGVLEGIRITRLGFPNRVIYAEFVKRYYLLVPDVPRNANDPKAASATILKGLKIAEGEYRFGITKVFFRAGQLAYIEELRERRIGEIIKGIQAACRGWLARQNYRSLRESTISARIIQQNLRAYLEFKNWPWWKLFSKARPLLKRGNLEKENKEKENQIRDLQSRLTLETAAKNQLAEQLKVAEAKIAQLEKALKEEKEKLLAMTDDKESLETDKIQLLKKIAILEDEIADQQKTIGDISAAKKSSDDKYKALAKELEEEQNLRVSIEKAKKKTEEELDDFKKQHEVDVETLAKLEKLKADLQQEVEELSDQFANETKARAAIEKNKKKVESELDDVDRK